MDTKSFPDNDKATANKSKRRITWITIIIVLVVAIIALVVSLFAFRTSRLEANDTKVPNIESRETAELKPGTVNSDRIVYAPNGDIVDVEGIYIPADTNDIYMVVEDPPEFPGGLQALSDYLRDNIKYPEACRKDSIQGRVIISFVVEKDGSISSAEVIKSVQEQLDTEALRVIRAMPKWKPGKQRGKTVRVEYAIPVKYRLDGSPYLTVPKRTDRIIENTTADIIEIVEEDSYIESIL